MSLPTDSCQNAQPDFSEMATTQGETSSAASATPRSGFNSRSQLRSRSTMTRRADGQEAEQRNDRSLDQDGCGLGNPEQPRRVAGRRLAATAGEIEPGQRALRQHGGGKQHCIGLGDARLESEPENAGQRNRRDQPGAIAEQPAAGREGGAHGDERRPAPRPGDRPRSAPRRPGPTAPARHCAASRCRPVSCSGFRPGSGCPRGRRSRPSASMPARSAVRRGRSAAASRCPAGTRTGKARSAAHSAASERQSPFGRMALRSLAISQRLRI